MIIGHYAAALWPYSRLRSTGCPFWLLLLCANVPEFLWLSLALANVEAPHPGSMFDATFNNLQVDMIYSHNLVPALLQAGGVSAGVFAVWRKQRMALWCGFLTVFHVLCDYVIGFEHQVLGGSSPAVAMNSYGRWPRGAILVEAAFVAACIFAFHRSEERQGRLPSPRRRLLLYAVFLVGILLWLPSATVPLRQLLP